VNRDRLERAAILPSNGNVFRHGRDRTRSNSAIFNASERPPHPDEAASTRSDRTTQTASAHSTFVRFCPARAPSRRSGHPDLSRSSDFEQINRAGREQRDRFLSGSIDQVGSVASRPEPQLRAGNDGNVPCRWHRSTPRPRARPRTGRDWCRTHRRRAAAPRRSGKASHAAEPGTTTRWPRHGTVGTRPHEPARPATPTTLRVNSTVLTERTR